MGKSSRPAVAVVIGSDSDLSTMRVCLDTLERFGINYEVRVISAHRTPAAAAEFADKAAQKGIKVIIAAAGMAAHLAGAMASRTICPVIGVPLVSGEALGGMDALLSTVQMPHGIPVATVALGKTGAANAAILALEILAIADTQIAGKLADFRQEMAEKVKKKDSSLQSGG